MNNPIAMLSAIKEQISNKVEFDSKQPNYYIIIGKNFTDFILSCKKNSIGFTSKKGNYLIPLYIDHDMIYNDLYDVIYKIFTENNDIACDLVEYEL